MLSLKSMHPSAEQNYSILSFEDDKAGMSTVYLRLHNFSLTGISNLILKF